MRRWIASASLLICALAVPGPADARWEDELAAFAAEDERVPPPPAAVLFVGSSSIRLWDGLESDLKAPPRVIKRGLAGSTLADCIANFDALVARYRPRHVFLYAGDNDLAEGRTPEEVAARFLRFAALARERLPQATVTFISIKPSPARRALIDKVRAANELVRRYARAQQHIGYVDVFTRMLGPNGLPRRELFRPDSLHLNRSGYELWRTAIRPHVDAALPYDE